MFGRKGKGGEEKRLREPHLSEGQDSYTFRRSRTLSGSLSNSVGATNAKRPDLKSERVRLHELHASKRFLRNSIGLMLLLALAVAFLLSNSVMFASFSVQSQVPKSDQEALRSAVTRYINRNPSQAFMFNLDEQQLTEALQANHPEVARIIVETAWFSNADKLIVDFRDPIVVWEIGGERFFVDENGAAFKRHYGPAPTLKVNDAAGVMPELAEKGSVASQHFIGYLGQLLGYLKAGSVDAVERVVIPPVPRQLDIYLKNRDYPIRTNTDRNPYAQAQDINHALQYFDKHQVTPKYVDVRVEGRAFYK